MVRKLCRPIKVPGVLPAGAANRPPSYAAVAAACSKQQLNVAVTNWYSIVRKEWESLTGVTDVYKSPKFDWKSASGDCAAQFHGGTSPATAWRILARRADECAAILRKQERNPTTTDTSILRTQAQKALRIPKTLSKSLETTHNEEMTRWAISLQ